MVKRKLIKSKILWQLPVASAEHNNTGYIHGNAKIHAFKWYDDNIMDWSLCGKYGQYAGDIECVDVDSLDEKRLCKKCSNLYKKLK